MEQDITLELKAPRVETLLETLPEPYTDVSGGTTYIGYAPLGVAEDAIGWRIVKKVLTSGVTTAMYPEGSMRFDFKWSDRATYTYSR